MTGTRLTLPAELLDEVIAHAIAESPRECCGLLAGRDGVVTHRFPLENTAAGAARFESSPRSMFAAVRAMRRLVVEIVAVYHSHPTSPAVPSRTDVELSYADAVACLIVSLAKDVPEVGVWWLRPEPPVPAEWVVTPRSFHGSGGNRGN